MRSYVDTAWVRDGGAAGRAERRELVRRWTWRRLLVSLAAVAIGIMGVATQGDVESPPHSAAEARISAATASEAPSS